ncbi:MAG: YphA family membrane protein, partial [Candidatus Alkaliphilus sp. MAG34]
PKHIIRGGIKMSGGMILLIVVALLILAGLGHRVLDRLRLSDSAALAILVAIALSTVFIPNIKLTDSISFNVGGFAIPMALAIYLFIKAETRKEKMRSIIGALGTGVAIYLMQRFILPADPKSLPIDPNKVYPIVGAIIAYALGRSRRGAFIAGVVGVVISDLIQLILNSINNIPSPTHFGGAGGVDTTIITGIFAVLIAEIVGEAREKAQGGTEKKDMKFDKGHFVSTLGENREEEEDQTGGELNIENEDKSDETGGDIDEKE